MVGLSEGAPRFIQVRARGGSFRRAGIAFDKGFTLFEEGDLSVEQLAALVGEPELEVQGSDDGENFVSIEAGDVPLTENVSSGIFGVDEVNELIEEKDRLADEVSGLKTHNVDLLRQLDAGEEQAKALIAARDELAGQVQDLRAEKAELTSKVATLEQQLKEAAGASPPAPAGEGEVKPAETKPAKPKTTK